MSINVDVCSNGLCRNLGGICELKNGNITCINSTSFSTPCVICNENEVCVVGEKFSECRPIPCLNCNPDEICIINDIYENGYECTSSNYCSTCIENEVCQLVDNNIKCISKDKCYGLCTNNQVCIVDSVGMGTCIENANYDRYRIYIIVLVLLLVLIIVILIAVGVKKGKGKAKEEPPKEEPVKK